MGRPPLPVGHYGNIAFRTLGPKKIRAKAYIRDPDGHRREVTALGTSQSSARTNLQDKIAERTGIGGRLTGDSKVREAATAWIAEIERLVSDGQRAPNTGRVYRSTLDTHVIPGVGELRLREATVPRLNAFVVTMRKHHRSALTKTARTVLNGILGHAARVGAITTNPMRDVARIAGEPAKTPRALTALERDTWLAAMEADDVAARHDLPDLTRFMLATGVRIGEALAVTFADIDVGAKTVRIDWTIDRIKGVGLMRGKTKSPAGRRTLQLPGWAVDLVIRRGDARGWDGPLFPHSRPMSTRNGLRWRDPSNVARDLRTARDAAGFDWVTSHAFRKTVATLLDESGLTSREVADQLGHAKVSMTQDHYMGRKTVSGAQAVALDSMWGGA